MTKKNDSLTNVELLDTLDLTDSEEVEEVKTKDEDTSEMGKYTVHVKDTVDAYLENISGFKVLSKSEEVELFTKVAEGDLEAKEEAINHNLKLVASVAKQYIRKGIEYEDLIQAGNIGLMTAIEKFEVKRGFKFSTYATWWIKQSIFRYIQENDRNVRLPDYLQNDIRKVNEVKQELKKELWREPTLDELHEKLPKYKKEKLEKIIQYSQLEYSLDKEMDDEGEKCKLMYFIENKNSPNPEETLRISELREMMERAFSKVLTEREAEIIRKRNGFDGGEELTLVQIGEELHMSRERVRQLEKIAMEKMKEELMNTPGSRDLLSSII